MADGNLSGTGIRACFCDLAGADGSDPDNHGSGCIGASILAVQRARRAAGRQPWTPMRNWLRRPA